MKNRYYILILLIFFLPYISRTFVDDGYVFSGMLGTTDGNNYLSIMNQAKEGYILFSNMYTSEDVPYINIRPTYLFAGWLSYVTNIPNIFSYHVFRAIGILLFIYYLEKIIKLAMKKDHKKTLFIALFASGIGFFFRLLTLFGIKQYGSIDLWITDANNFLIMMTHPHTIISVALMAGTAYYFIRWVHEKKLKFIIYAGMLSFILGFEHLFDVITLGLAFGFMFLEDTISRKRIDWKRVKHLLIYGLIISAPFIYTYMMFMLPEYAAWNDQNVLDTPKLIQVIFGYGFMFFSFMAVVFYHISRKDFLKARPAVRLMIYWIAAVLILIYSPFNIQRRFLEGGHIPFAILTGYLLFEIMPVYLNSLNRKTISTISIAIIILMLPTNIMHFYNDMDMVPDGRGEYPYSVPRFIYEEEKAGLKWLADNSEYGSVILSTYNIGNYIPAYMNQKVYVGHWAQTIDLEDKYLKTLRYYADESEIPEGIDYVWYGVDENIINQDFIPEGELIYENMKVKIYKV